MFSRMKVHKRQRTTHLVVATFAIVGITVLWLQLPTTSYTVPLVSPLAVQFPSRLLPFKYWEHRRLYADNYYQISCNNIPQLEDIEFAAGAWQRLQINNGNVYIYGAYWDDRFNEPLVRVLIYCDTAPLPKLACQFWYEDENAPITVPSTVIYGWEPAWGGPRSGINEPYILICRARRHPPYTQRAPAAVSVMRDDMLCGMPTNLLNVQGVPLPDTPVPPLNPNTISVCLKWLHFREDMSAELVEWIELIKAFGATKLFVFEVESHPNTRQVLNYYVNTGFADVTNLAHAPQLLSNYSPTEQNFHDMRRELLLNDCLYRSIHKYQWITPIDIDEIIVPISYDTWQQVIAEEMRQGLEWLDAIAFRNYYFVDPAQQDLAAPPYMKKLGHLWRSVEPNPPGFNVKAFHNTASVVAMHNHYPMSCDTHSCWTTEVNMTIGLLYHYRKECESHLSNCLKLDEVVRDNTLTRWKHLIKEVDHVLTILGIKP